MKLTISNIAWDPAQDEVVCRLMQQHGVTGVEIAPTKIWPRPLEASDDDIAACAKYWRERGIRISSLQALLFGRPDLTLFGAAEKRDEASEYLEGIIRLAGRLGAEALVFGSPANRRVGDQDRGRAEEIAVEFFRKIGKMAAKHNTVFCIEPNPEAYGCDFVTTSAEGRDLVAKVGEPGFGLHLDAAGMTLSREDVGQELPKSIPGLCHFHISEPDLKLIGSGGVDHALFSRCLHDGGYDRWFSVEMRAPGGAQNVTGVARALQLAREFYS
jgi:sugar phosphate isomerase/epimerase